MLRRCGSRRSAPATTIAIAKHHPNLIRCKHL
nr:MAG TPA: hypothetical protein [Caudoviricetes sp.]